MYFTERGSPYGVHCGALSHFSMCTLVANTGPVLDNYALLSKGCNCLDVSVGICGVLA